MIIQEPDLGVKDLTISQFICSGYSSCWMLLASSYLSLGGPPACQDHADTAMLLAATPTSDLQTDSADQK